MSDFHSDDFATARPERNRNTHEAWRIAEKYGLSGAHSSRFTQGFIHSRQGRNDLRGRCEFYDRGHAAAALVRRGIKI